MKPGIPASEEFLKALPILVDQYIDDCMEHTKEVATGSGKIVDIKDRQTPTVQYFLNIWLPRNYGETFCRDTYYSWLRGETTEEKQKLIEDIEEKFKALAIDVLANEGGTGRIFYAKNKLGFTDKVENTVNATVNQITGMEIK